jgi:hypothetical protein
MLGRFATTLFQRRQPSFIALPLSHQGAHFFD